MKPSFCGFWTWLLDHNHVHEYDCYVNLANCYVAVLPVKAFGSDFPSSALCCCTLRVWGLSLWVGNEGHITTNCCWVFQNITAPDQRLSHARNEPVYTVIVTVFITALLKKEKDITNYNSILSSGYKIRFGVNPCCVSFLRLSLCHISLFSFLIQVSQRKHSEPR